MGQEASRLKEKLGNGRRQGSREELKSRNQEAQAYQATLSPATSAAVSPVSAARLPTPEYGTNDVKSPLPDTVVSPLSPASSPELPGETKPISRKAIGATEGQLRHAKSSQALAPGPINTGLAVRSPMGLPTSPRPGVPKQTELPAAPAVDQNQVTNQAQFVPVSPTPNQNQKASQPQYTAYSPPAERDQTSQKQYIPYSPPADRNPGLGLGQFPTPSPKAGEDERALPAAPAQELSQTAPPQSTTTQQQPRWQQNPSRDPMPRTISETGSVETVKPSHAQNQNQDPTPLRQQPSHPSLTLTAPAGDLHPNTNTVIHGNDGNLPPLREPDPNEPDTTNHPGAALFPRNWYTPSSSTLPSQQQQQPQPPTARQRNCITQHRYMTANRQRVNPVACRTCGCVDRNAECYICSACALNVCKGCVVLLRRWKGDLEAVGREVVEGMGGKEVEGGKEVAGEVEVGRGRRVERDGFAWEGGEVGV